MVDPIDSKNATGFLSRYTWSGKMENVAVENIRFVSEYSSDIDESHGWNAVGFSKTENAWVRNIEAWHFGYSAVSIAQNSSQISIINCKNMDPVSQSIGSRRYSFNILGERNLIKDCFTRNGRHDYVTGNNVAGPNVFLNCSASQQTVDIGPHHRQPVLCTIML